MRPTDNFGSTVECYLECNTVHVYYFNDNYFLLNIVKNPNVTLSFIKLKTLLSFDNYLN